MQCAVRSEPSEIEPVRAAIHRIGHVSGIASSRWAAAPIINITVGRKIARAVPIAFIVDGPAMIRPPHQKTLSPG
jgi:hypothetical protein